MGDVTTIAAAVVAVVGVLECFVLWRVARASRSWRQVESNVARFGDALALLTEASETGFRSIAAELVKDSDQDRPWNGTRPSERSAARANGRGLAATSRPGDSMMVEGEARLRSYLTDHSVACPCSRCASSAAPQAGVAM